MTTPQEIYEALPFEKPPYDPTLHDPHLAGLQNATSYEEYMEYHNHIEEHASRSKSPTRPSKDFEETFSGWDFRSAAGLWDKNCTDQHILAVFTVFCRQLSWFGIAPLDADEKNDDAFVWSKVICVLAAAGHPHWARLCSIVKQSYAFFPYGNEDFEEWEDLVSEASQFSGWPCTLPLLEWSKMRSPPVEPILEHVGPARVVGGFHVLKHCYINSAATHVHVMFQGQVLVKPCKMGETLHECVGQTGSLARALGSTLDTRAKKFPVERGGVKWALQHLTPRNLLRLRNKNRLPPAVLHGPWSGTVPDPTTRHGFVQHGVRLSGVWVAKQGQIIEEHGEDEDVLGWEWDSSDNFSYENLVAKKEFEHALPSKYHAASPYRVFIEAFPNLIHDNEATAILFDLPIYAGLMRSYVKCLEQELPMVLFLPNNPTLEDSTNQGKSLAALTYGRAMVPGIGLTRVRDGAGGAPQQRADVSKIEQFGTLVLDEWRPPRSDGHILSHDNLQSLIVGGTITAGKVLENAGEIRLAHSLVASAKCIYFPDDMVNRSFFWYLDPLTEGMRENAKTLDAIRNGAISLLMRLGAWADIEQHNLVQRLMETPKSSGALRFEGINTLARILCSIRGVELDELSLAVRNMATRYASHYLSAEDTGLAKAASGDQLRIGLADILEWDNTELNALRDSCNTIAGTEGTVSVRDFMKSMLRIVEGNAALPLSTLLPRLIGETKRNVSDRLITLRVGSEITRRMKEGQYMMHPSPLHAMAGWYFARGTDQGGVMVRLANSLKDGEPEKLGFTEGKI